MMSEPPQGASAFAEAAGPTPAGAATTRQNDSISVNDGNSNHGVLLPSVQTKTLTPKPCAGEAAEHAGGTGPTELLAEGSRVPGVGRGHIWVVLLQCTVPLLRVPYYCDPKSENDPYDFSE